MNEFTQNIKAEFKKVRHTPFILIHMLVPLIGLALFLIYYKYSLWNSFNKVEGYLQVLTIVFPLIIGILCAMLIEQESGTGHFYYALLAKNKAIYFISKLGILLVLAVGSLSFAIIGFGIGFQFLLHQNTFSISFYIISIVIIFVSQVFLYVLHLFLSLRFSTGASIGLGIVESLLTALLQTGLGDGIWKWIPCSWSARLSKNYMLYLSEIQFKKLYSSEFRTGLVFCILMTIIIFAYVIIWFPHFEGRKEE